MASTQGGKRTGAGRPKGSVKAVPSVAVRIPQDVADIIKERFADTQNPRLRDWIKKLP